MSVPVRIIPTAEFNFLCIFRGTLSLSIQASFYSGQDNFRERRLNSTDSHLFSAGPPDLNQRRLNSAAVSCSILPESAFIQSRGDSLGQ